MNSTEKFVYMANQIARNMEAMGDGSAEAMVADHIDKFWDPRMKQTIFALVETGGQGLDPLALAALRRLASVRSAPSLSTGG